MPLLSAGLTDVGQTRQTNQDSIYLDQKNSLFVVADGMGGHNGGDIASNLAIESIPKYIRGHKTGPYQPQMIYDAIKYANKVIQAESVKNPKLNGMGTTVTAFLFNDANLYIANVGDSRGYLFHRHKIFQLTSDHSLIQEKINLGIISRAEALLDPQKNVLIRAVGFEDNVQIDIFNYKVTKHDLFLLCSDGLHGKVSEEDMLLIIQTCIPDITNTTKEQLDTCVHAMVGLANINGGHDNISAILIYAS